MVNEYNLLTKTVIHGRPVEEVVASLKEERKVVRKALQGIVAYNHEQRARKLQQDIEMHEAQCVLALTDRSKAGQNAEKERALEVDLMLSELVTKWLIDNTTAE